MFDFRYHAISLAAVFVALVLGLLLGVAIGDQGLVSSAENRLRDDLREDVTEARRERDELEAEVEERARFEELTYPRLVEGRLEARRVVLLFLDERSESIFDHVRDAIAPSGGDLAYSSRLRLPLDLEAIAGATEGTQFEQVVEDVTLLDELGRRLGVQVVRGGRLLGDVSESLLAESSGELQPAEAVVLVRTPGERLEDEAREQADALIEGLIAGMADLVPVVGVEEISTDPSQIPWYTEHGLASVDNVNAIPGRASLVYTLSGEADGAYGVKDTADAFIPDALVAVR